MAQDCTLDKAGAAVADEQANLTLSDYFDIHLDRAPKARSIGGGRVNVVGLRLPEDEEEIVPLTRAQKFKRRLAEIWSSVAGV